MNKIAFAGTDGRTLQCAFVVSTATSDRHENDCEGIVIRGTPAMPRFARMMDWPVRFLATASNTVSDYADAVIDGLRGGLVDCVVPMPEALLFEGLVDRVADAGFGDRILGLDSAGAFIEGDKIQCKELCRDAGIPVAPGWTRVDARDAGAVLEACLTYIHAYGGAVLKYPFSAGGKGARIIVNTWEIREVYDTLIRDYRDGYKARFGKKDPWPLLVESLMSGVEISFTILVDGKGNYQILPTAMDYPERFEGPAGKDNPITGGTGAISPHPMETPELIEAAGRLIARPLIQALKDRGILRPCVLYPGCFVSLDARMQPVDIRVCEINIRPGEPEAQPVVRRLRNLGPLIQAAMTGNLDAVAPEVREDQVAVCVALMTGPGGPDGQKGYPWSCTKGEPVEIDLKYLRRKGIQVIPSAMTYLEDEDRFQSDGTRVAYLNGNVTVRNNDSRAEAGFRLSRKLVTAFDNGRIRVVPREDARGNRLDLRRDIGLHYRKAADIFPAVLKP